MDSLAVDPGTEPRSPLQVDLVEMLQALGAAERVLFEMVPAERREAARSIGDWSVKDVRAHMAAWRAIEARRLEAAATQERPGHDDDPGTDDAVDDSNAVLHARYADWSWDAVAREADASIDALVEVISRSSTEMLCECDGTFAGIGANGVNHAMGHLPDVATLGGGGEQFGEFVQEIEAVLGRNHLMPRDSGVILYNVACARALSGDLDEARRLLRAAFSRRADLLESAMEDPDLAALGGDLSALAPGAAV
ncbi:MAG: hypothetical protein M3O78_07010 [Chloroflexota bacterium]|nr:hypothetical protein [Chloroflexota bacterium]